MAPTNNGGPEPPQIVTITDHGDAITTYPAGIIAACIEARQGRCIVPVSRAPTPPPTAVSAPVLMRPLSRSLVHATREVLLSLTLGQSLDSATRS
jgi:hypothetical protein